MASNEIYCENNSKYLGQNRRQNPKKFQISKIMKSFQ